MFSPTTLALAALALLPSLQDKAPAEKAPTEAAARGDARPAAKAEGKQGEGKQGEGKNAPSPLGALVRAETWPEALARDAQVSFGVRTSASAAAVLARADSGESQRAAALMALGCAHVANERPRLESFANEGTAVLRRAAILALGEMKSGDITNLADLAERKAPTIASYALLAMTRNGSTEALNIVRAVADDPANPLASVARTVLAFHDDPAQGESCEFARVLLDLRFAAARDHGLVNGQVWHVLVLDDLCRNRAFLGRVIYRAASELKRPGIRDHFLEIALDATLPERWRGVVNAMPTELSTMIESGLIAPSDDKDWKTLLVEIDRRGLEGFTDPILRRAFLVPGLRGAAAALLARAGSAGSLDLLQLGLESDDASERALCAEALGATAKNEYLPSVTVLADDPAAQVRAAALVAEVRLGSTSALAKVRTRLGLDAPVKAKPGDASEVDVEPAALALDAEAEILLDSLSRAARDGRVRDLLIELLPRLVPPAQAKVGVPLLELGNSQAHASVYQWLRDARPRGPLAARAIAALTVHPLVDDLDLLHDLFPYEDEIDVNVEIACALLRLHDPAATPVLRAALWTEPWNRSVLAGALWIEAIGLDSLRLEVQHPPPGAGARDQRRVGFALGEWGGVDEVEWLAARLSAGDPGLEGAMLGALGARTH